MPEPVILDRTLTIGQLDLSPFNVRTDERDTSATGSLEASILERGLLQAISVHPMRGSKTRWGTFAGGRRYRSIRNLVARGALPADWPVPVREYVGYSDPELIELSLVENEQRRDLRDYERYAAVRRAHKRGHSVEAIAQAISQDSAMVRRWLRMGELAEPIFAAFKAEQLSADEAEAYAATADPALQLAVFEELSKRSAWERQPDQIRAALKVGDEEAGRQLRFVGEEAYRAAGGRFELDLFAGAANVRGRVVDEGILRKLVDAKLDDFRRDLRRRVGRAELRFVPEPPRREGGLIDHSLRIDPRAGEDDAIVLPGGDVVGRIVLNAAGEPYVDWWWASRSAKFGSERAPRPPVPNRTRIAAGAAVGQSYDGARQRANAAIKHEAGLTQDAVEIFRSLRRTILRAILVTAARSGRAIGRDYLVWAQLRMVLASYPDLVGGAQTGLRPLSGENSVGMSIGTVDLTRQHVAATRAAKEWDGAVAELKRERFVAEKDLPAAFIAYLDAPGATKDLAAAVVAGLALERSLNAAGFQIPLHDTVAAFARLSTDRAVRDIWAPTEVLIGMLPKSQQLAIVEPLVEQAVFAGWTRLKASEVTANVVAALTGTGLALRTSKRDEALHWVHPLLAFRPDARADEPASAELEEAAE